MSLAAVFPWDSRSASPTACSTFPLAHLIRISNSFKIKPFPCSDMPLPPLPRILQGKWQIHSFQDAQAKTMQSYVIPFSLFNPQLIHHQILLDVPVVRSWPLVFTSAILVYGSIISLLGSWKSFPTDFPSTLASLMSILHIAARDVKALHWPLIIHKIHPKLFLQHKAYSDFTSIISLASSATSFPQIPLTTLLFPKQVFTHILSSAWNVPSWNLCVVHSFIS